MGSIAADWRKHDARRSGLKKRWERYASFTLPRLYTKESWNEESDELSWDWQSLGGQAVNHVVNKLMLALFAPSRPFMRLQATPKFLAKLPAEVKPEDIESILSSAENEAVKKLDAIPNARSRLYLVLAYLVVLGNTMIRLPDSDNEAPEVFNLHRYIVRRTGLGKVKTIVIRDCLRFGELETEVQEAVKASSEGYRYQEDTKVELFRRVQLNDRGGYELDQALDDIPLPDEFSASWKDEDELPYRVLTWNLKDRNHYGTGLVEDYNADFAGLSTLSEATIKAAILSSEFRWLVNPGGQTKVEDLENSENGAALPGLKDDISLVLSNKGAEIQVIDGVAQEFIRRIGRGFLMNSAVTRSAERVTAEEIRLQAQELETSFGGTYTTVAGDLQRPLAKWLLRAIKLRVSNQDIETTIVTGLAALSRAGDLDNLRGAMGDVMQTAQARQFLPHIKWDAVDASIFQGWGLSVGKYIKPPEQVQKEQQEAQQAQVNQQAAVAGAEAGAQQGAVNA